MLGEYTKKAVEDYSSDIVKFSKINIGDKNRTRISKMTGKKRRGKIDSTGKLRRSFTSKLTTMDNSFKMAIEAEDYAQDVNDGAVRRLSESQALKWIKDKPIRFREGNKFVKATEARKRNFAKFVAWKVSKIGSDYTGYFDEAVADATTKNEDKITEAAFRDAEAAAEAALKSLNNGDS